MFRLTLKHRGKGEILVARSINKVGSSIGVINTRASASAQVGSGSQGKHRQACPQALKVAATTHGGQPGIINQVLFVQGLRKSPGPVFVLQDQLGLTFHCTWNLRGRDPTHIYISDDPPAAR